MSILLATGAAAGQAQSDAEDTTVTVTDKTLSGSDGGTYGLILEPNGELKTYNTLGSTTSHPNEWGRPLKPAIGGYFRAELFLLSGDAPDQGGLDEVLIDGSASEWAWKGPVSGSVTASCSIHIRDQEGLIIDDFNLDVDIS